MLIARSQPLITIKNRDELAGMRKAGRLASRCLQFICDRVAPGMSTQDLDDLQMQFLRDYPGVRPAPLNYKGFPKSLCTSVNEVICHGIPSSKHILKEGDVIGVDVTLIVDGFYGDNAATVPVGRISDANNQLLHVTLASLRRGIEAARAGSRLGDIGHAIQSLAESHGYGVVRDFVGHGIGRQFHEPPQVSHVGQPGRGVPLRAGMTFTIEPMVNGGSWRCRVLQDGWTAVTHDNSISVQFEHTIAVGADGPEILTVQNEEGVWENPGRCVLPEPPAGFVL